MDWNPELLWTPGRASSDANCMEITRMQILILSIGVRLDGKKPTHYLDEIAVYNPTPSMSAAHVRIANRYDAKPEEVEDSTLRQGPLTFKPISTDSSHPSTEYAEHRTPSFQTPRRFKVSPMFSSGLPSTRTRSALNPARIRPRSWSRNLRAVMEVAERRASMGVNPQCFTSMPSS